jgi:hypothetical protein
MIMFGMSMIGVFVIMAVVVSTILSGVEGESVQ